MKTRMHPTIILEKLVGSFAFVVIIGYSFLIQIIGDVNEKAIKKTSSLLGSISGNVFLIGIITFILILVILIVFFYFQWRNTYLFFEKSNLIIEKGKIFKKVTTIHLSDIAAINIKRNIFEKIVGTAHLKFELNMSSDQSFASKLVFEESKALEIKNNILTHVGKETEEKNETFDSVVDYQTKDVIKHMWLSIDISVIIIIAITYFFIMFGAIGNISSMSTIFIIISIAVAALPVAYNLIKNFLSYYGFKVNRDNDNIKLSYGALTTYKYNLPIHRINAIIIKQTLQARIAKFFEIEVVNAGMGSEAEEKTLLSLYSKKTENDIVFNEVIPEYKNNIILQKQKINALKHYLLAKTPWIIIGVALSFVTHFISLIIIPLVLAVAVLQYIVCKIGFDADKIIIQKGLINKKTSIIKFQNIELIEIRKHILSSLFNTQSLKINVVGPLTNNTFTSGFFSKDILESVVNQYLEEKRES